MDLQHFQHEALPSPRSFRLFSLLAGPDGDVKLKLEIFSIDDPPEYDAISMAWDPAANKSPLVINDASASVPAAVLPALRGFRKSMTLSTTKFWIDALCINRTDTADQTAQARIRPEILQKAGSVHIWIPEDDKAIEEATVKCIKEGHEMLNSILRPHDGYADKAELHLDFLNKSLVRARHGRPDPLTYDWSPVRNLLSKPWFKRKLAFQEQSWPKSAFLHYGTSMVSYDKLGEILFQFHRANRLLDIAGYTDEGKAILLRVVQLYFYRVARQALEEKLKENVFHYHVLCKATSSHGFECDDPKDYLYSIVTMMHEYDAEDPLLQPDYSLTWQEVFARFSAWSLKREPTLHSLSIAAGPSADSLPSWACDLRNRVVAGSLAVAEPVFKAGGPQKAELQISVDHKVVQLKAKFVDSIGEIQSSWQDQKATESEKLEPFSNEPPEDDEEKEQAIFAGSMIVKQLKWFDSCVELASRGHVSPDGPRGMTDERFDAFRKTMTVEAVSIRPRGTDEDKSQESFMHYAMLAKERNTAVIMQQHVFKDGAFHDTEPNAKRDGVVEAENSMAFALAVTEFSITSQDRMALVPKSAKPGDEICVIQGAQVPYVVRRSPGGRCQLIGECYLSGVMDGEALDGNDGPLEWMEIE